MESSVDCDATKIEAHMALAQKQKQSQGLSDLLPIGYSSTTSTDATVDLVQYTFAWLFRARRRRRRQPHCYQGPY